MKQSFLRLSQNSLAETQYKFLFTFRDIDEYTLLSSDATPFNLGGVSFSPALAG